MKLQRRSAVVWVLSLLLLAGCSANPTATTTTNPADHGKQTAPPVPVSAPVEGKNVVKVEPVPVGTAPSGVPGGPVEQKGQPGVWLYSPRDLIAGKTEPLVDWQLEEPNQSGMAVSPDRTHLLFYPGDFMLPWFAPFLLAPSTGEKVTLNLAEEKRWLTYAGWLPDGRLLLAGDKVWIGGPKGEDLRPIADAGFAWSGWVSPQGSHLALWGPGEKGQIKVIDLQTGRSNVVTGPFRRGCQDCGVTLAWSPDGKLLAGSDYDNDATGLNPRIRIVDPATGKQILTHEGLALVAWLSDGSMLGWRRSPDDPEKGELTRIGLDADERIILDRWANPSPDGRYLLNTVYGSGRPVHYLIDLANGQRVELPLQGGWLQWTDQSDLILYTAPG